jgi:transposase
MLPRHAISDENWERIKGFLPGQSGQHGGVAKDNRLFIDAVLYVARTGIPWEDLPARFGKWNSVWRRFDRWAAKGRWDPILAALRDPDLDILIFDSTAVRAHACAAGAKKNGMEPAVKRVKRSAAAEVDLARKFMGVLTGSDIQPS